MRDPCELIFGGLTSIRNRAYDLGVLPAARAGCPVISVGNLVLGGSGKSPFVSYTCSELLRAGRRPVILLRGYGGSDAGPRLITSNCRAAEVGDEAVMHHQEWKNRVPVVVCRKRINGANFIVKRNLGDVVVLDDGFQHRGLIRDIDLVLADTAGESLDTYLNSARLLPFGRFREPPRTALARASALILVERWPREASRVNRVPKWVDLPIWTFKLLPRCVEQYDEGVGFTGRELPLDDFRGKPVVVVSAIASTKGFAEMVRALGMVVIAESHFSDHHQYRAAELDGLLSGIDSDIPLITTAKDVVKLENCLVQRREIWVLRLAGAFVDPADREKFVSLLSTLS